jgi:metallo-beta-lactamase family protein
MSITLTFYGAARTVTGSMHLVEVDGLRILLDCGLFQGHRKEAFERNRTFPFDPASIDCVLLSHAHIDHAGNLPTLVKNGFRGDIYTTFASRDLCGAMLLDSAHIQEKDAEYLNRHRNHRKEVAEPLYTLRDAVESLRYFRGVGYHRPFTPGPGVTVEFLDAGHILGSAITVCTIVRRHRSLRLVFTGDLGRKGLPVIRDPERVTAADYLISESTYGGRARHAPADVEQELLEVIVRTAGRGGKVIIPAFSVGRTQEIVYTLHQLTLKESIPDLPIFVDSPLSASVTDIFRLHPECFDEDTGRLLLNAGDPFGFHRLQYTRDVEESKRINGLRMPCVIIAASGMCETGRVLHHLKNTVEDPRNTVLIVSYQAEGTLGKRLVDRAEEIRIFGEPYTRRAEVAVINGFSAHADRHELLSWIDGIDGGLRQVFLVHGDLDQAEALAQGIQANRTCRITIPERGERVRL